HHCPTHAHERRLLAGREDRLAGQRERGRGHQQRLEQREPHLRQDHVRAEPHARVGRGPGGHGIGGRGRHGGHYRWPRGSSLISKLGAGSVRFSGLHFPRMSWEMIRNLVRDEWVILSLLLAWSLAGLTVICERLYALWNILPKSEQFKNRVIGALEAGDIGKAAALCEMSQVPLAEVFERGLQVFQKTPHKTSEAVTSQRGAAVLSCKRYLWALGTVGSSAPFV